MTIGRNQFYEYETHGKRPENPLEYYNVLLYGKKYFNMISTTMREDYQQRFSVDESGDVNSWKWPGLYYYHINYKGERHILKKLLTWWKSETGNELPEWVCNENEDY